MWKNLDITENFLTTGAYCGCSIHRSLHIIGYWVLLVHQLERQILFVLESLMYFGVFLNKTIPIRTYPPHHHHHHHHPHHTPSSPPPQDITNKSTYTTHNSSLSQWTLK